MRFGGSFDSERYVFKNNSIAEFRKNVLIEDLSVHMPQRSSWLPSLPSSSSLLKVPIIINDCHPTSFNKKYYCHLTVFLVYSFSYLSSVENKVVHCCRCC